LIKNKGEVNMPILIPENPSFNGSYGDQGEKRILHLLKKLPDDCIVYHELDVQGKRPDFIIFSPRLGILIMEVKAWNAKRIIDGNQNNIYIKNRKWQFGESKSIIHPIRQINNYLHLVKEILLDDPLLEEIGNLKENNNNEKRLSCPLAVAIAFTNITRLQLNNHGIQQSKACIPHEIVLLKDELNTLDDQEISGMELENKLERFFNPAWKLSLSDRQRSVIHSILIHKPTSFIVPEVNVTSEQRIKNTIESILKKYLLLEHEKHKKSEYMSSVTSEINLISKDTSPDIDNTNFINQHSESINRLVSKISQGITESATHDADELYSHSKAIKLKTEETVIKKTICDIEKQQQALKSKLSRLAFILEVEIA
jgi:hypothetical protein